MEWGLTSKRVRSNWLTTSLKSDTSLPHTFLNRRRNSNMPPTEIAQRLEFARAVSQEAAKLILSYYMTPELVVDLKRDRSPVTAADRGAEELIRDRIAQQFPDDGFFGEEFGETAGRNGVRWVLDPVDGTKAFIHGVPLFGTLIGLEADGELLAGVCRFPALNEVIYGGQGLGAWWQIGKVIFASYVLVFYR